MEIYLKTVQSTTPSSYQKRPNSRKCSINPTLPPTKRPNYWMGNEDDKILLIYLHLQIFP